MPVILAEAPRQYSVGIRPALGESGALSPFLAVWAAPAIFGALAVRTFLALEG